MSKGTVFAANGWQSRTTPWTAQQAQDARDAYETDLNAAYITYSIAKWNEPNPGTYGEPHNHPSGQAFVYMIQDAPDDPVAVGVATPSGATIEEINLDSWNPPPGP